MQRGFTLIEVMIAAAIVAILAAIAVPSYQRYQLKTNREAGEGCLVEAQRRLETAYQHTNSYPTNLIGAGYSTATVTCGDSALYVVSLQPSSASCSNTAGCVQLIAQAQGRQVKDGNLRLTVNTSQYLNNATTSNSAGSNLYYVKDHLPPGASTWVASWDFQPGS